MRVIAGSARGRPLRSLKGHWLRPTLDRVKEAVFSSLNFQVPDARVLDLYAGSGALGIEALSRGARSATFVDHDPQACELIRKNILSCGWAISNDIRVTRMDVFRWLKKAEGKYDIILADPPYERGYEEALLDLLSDRDMLVTSGTLALESAARTKLPEIAGKLRLLKSRMYGDTKISYYTVGDARDTGGFTVDERDCPVSDETVSDCATRTAGARDRL